MAEPTQPPPDDETGIPPVTDAQVDDIAAAWGLDPATADYLREPGPDEP